MSKVFIHLVINLLKLLYFTVILIFNSQEAILKSITLRLDYEYIRSKTLESIFFK